MKTKNSLLSNGDPMNPNTIPHDFFTCSYYTPSLESTWM